MDNKEQCRKLANRIYELDEKVYKTSGSGLGKTFTGEKARVLDNLTVLIVSNPQGHLLRSELALIGNMARSIRDKDARHDLLIEYNDILEEIANLPMSFGSVDIVDKDLADMNSSILNKNFSEKDHLVICISRSHGSAGTDIGFALAEALHIIFPAERFDLRTGKRGRYDYYGTCCGCRIDRTAYSAYQYLYYRTVCDSCAPYDGTEESGSEAGNQSGAQDGSQASGLLSFFYGKTLGRCDQLRSVYQQCMLWN